LQLFFESAAVSLDVSDDKLDEELEKIVVGTPPKRIVIEEINLSAGEMDTLNFEAPVEVRPYLYPKLLTKLSKFSFLG
jgi:hypothetical protein